MKNTILKPVIYLSLLITFTVYTTKTFSCTVPTNLTLNYTFTTAVAGETVEVTWTADCPNALMEITLVNVPLWTGQQFYANIPNTGSYFFAINPNIIPGPSLFVIIDMGRNIWNYGPEFELLAPLPVELSEFKANLSSSGKAVDLSFKTNAELNASHFDIQHSRDGKTFQNIGKLEAYGTSSTERSYHFTHESPQTGNNYYRLKQVDYDGTFEYSDLVSVDFRQTTQIEVFPNPSQGTVYFSGTSELPISIKVLDSFGKTLSQQLIAVQQFDISGLPNGVYFIVFYIDNQAVTRRILKHD